MAGENSIGDSESKLDKALNKSRNCLDDDNDDPQSTFLRHYAESLKRENRESDETPRKRIHLKSNTSGLNLRTAYHREMNSNNSNESSSNVAKMKRASIMNNDRLKIQGINENKAKCRVFSSDSEQSDNNICFKKCEMCYSVSSDYRFCDRCRKSLPKDSKATYVVAKHSTTDVVNSTNRGKQNFYGRKLQDQLYNNLLGASKAKPITPRQSLRQPRKNNSSEPVCLTISSDEEDKIANSNVLDSESGTVIKYADSECALRTKRHLAETQVNSQSMVQVVKIKCRSVRIGSFKYKMDIPVRITPEGFEISAMRASGNKDNENVLVQIGISDIVKLIYHFGSQVPVFFIYTTPGCAGNICSMLKMSSKQGLYYNPSGNDETQKRIVLLPDGLQTEQEMLIRYILAEYLKQTNNEKLIEEIDGRTADQMLVRSTPPEVRKMARLSVERSRVPPPLPRSDEPAVKMMTYPPPPATGGITITSDDYNCLHEEEFLNDVIIDFYLKYLVQNKLSPIDQKRTHIFSSFFYRRLTMRATRKNTSPEDMKLPAPELRHSRVKTWTRHVDIFEKDFVIIPINEHSHWFLAVICFPYLEGPIQFCQRDWPTENGTVQTNDDNGGESSREWSPNSMEYSRNEAVDENYEEMDESIGSTLPQSDSSGPIMQPCILMFDSLQGPSRGRVVTTLRDYLRVEWQAKKQSKRSFDKNCMLGSSPKVPQQTNYSDCGIYVLQYVESFFEEPIEDFTIPICKLKTWFTKEEVCNKRRNIQKLIYDLMIEQHGRDVREKNSDEQLSELES